MKVTLTRVSWRLARRFKRLSDALVGVVAVGFLKLVRRADPDRIADLAGAVMRAIGPWLPEQRVGRANLKAAFPDKSAAEIEDILRGVWDNVGRVGAEFAHIDRLWDLDPTRPGVGRVEFSAESAERYLRLRDDGKPALVFAAHLGNWELPALAATAHGLDSAVLFRNPNVAAIAKAILDLRTGNMGTLLPTNSEAPFKLIHALERGQHVGMLVDQHYSRGVDVTFFGRTCKANPLLARLARHHECPIHGVRVIRLPKHRFHIDLTEAIEPVRNAEGKIDVQATMQVITTIIEGWVRQYPEQWLWLHRRWR